jgi:hypothetical protein
MDQPLWQNWLNIAFIGFVARRAAVSVALHWDSLNALTRGMYLMVLIACALAGVAVWLSTRLVMASLCFVAATFSVASLVEMVQVEPALRLGIGAQLGVALLATLGLVKLARRNEREVRRGQR